MGAHAVLCDIEWRVGDRWEVFASAATETSVRVALPRELRDVAVAPQVVEDEARRPLAAALTPAGDAIDIAGPAGRSLLQAGVDSIWIEFVAPRRYRLLATQTPDARICAASPNRSESKATTINGGDRVRLRRS